MAPRPPRRPRVGWGVAGWERASGCPRRAGPSGRGTGAAGRCRRPDGPALRSDGREHHGVDTTVDTPAHARRRGPHAPGLGRLLAGTVLLGAGLGGFVDG